MRRRRCSVQPQKSDRQEETIPVGFLTAKGAGLRSNRIYGRRRLWILDRWAPIKEGVKHTTSATTGTLDYELVWLK